MKKEMEAPAWIIKMTETPRWRQLLYDLSQAHPDCALLNFAVQRIADAGLYGEISTLGAVASFFGVFSRVFGAETVRALGAPPDTVEHEEHVARLKEMCSKRCAHTAKKKRTYNSCSLYYYGRSEQTFLFAECILQRALDKSNGPLQAAIVRRLAQELSDSRSAARRKLARRIVFALKSVDDYPVVRDALMALLDANETNPSDLMKLYDVYNVEKVKLKKKKS